MTCRLVLAVSNVCEVATAALYKVLNDNAKVVVMKTSDVKTMTRAQLVSLINKNPCDEILMIGTYWEHMLDVLREEYPFLHIKVLCPGNGEQAVSIHKVKTQYIYGKDPCAYVMELAEQELESKTCVRLVARMFKKTLKIIDERFRFVNVNEHQAFFTGMFNMEPLDKPLSLLDKYVKYFQGGYDEEEIWKNGRAVVDSQVEVSRQRAMHNSKQIEFEDGTKVAITTAPEFVNLTHDALKDKHPECDVSLCVNIRFLQNLNLEQKLPAEVVVAEQNNVENKSTDNSNSSNSNSNSNNSNNSNNNTQTEALHFSIRSYAPHISAQDLAKKIGGDGDKKMGGGSTEIQIRLPW